MGSRQYIDGRHLLRADCDELRQWPMKRIETGAERWLLPQNRGLQYNCKKST
jgi:hypothetical protein